MSNDQPCMAVQSFYLKFSSSPQNYSLILTDLIHVWKEDCTFDQLEEKINNQAKSFMNTPKDQFMPYLEKMVKGEGESWNWNEPTLRTLILIGTFKIKLEWSFELERMPNETEWLKEQWSIPFFEMSLHQHAMIQQLNHIILEKEKDVQNCIELLKMNAPNVRPKMSKFIEPPTMDKNDAFKDKDYQSLYLSFIPKKEIPIIKELTPEPPKEIQPLDKKLETRKEIQELMQKPKEKKRKKLL